MNNYEKEGTDMKYLVIGNREISVLTAGCMRIAGMTKEDVRAYIHGALNIGIDFFDHADIYGGDVRKNSSELSSKRSLPYGRRSFFSRNVGYGMDGSIFPMITS